MLTKADEMNAERRKLDADIATLDRDIEGRERRLSLVRRHREELYRRRMTLDAQVQREEAPLIKPLGKCVTIEAHDGVQWDI